jgi:hypothetical protein
MALRCAFVPNWSHARLAALAQGQNLNLGGKEMPMNNNKSWCRFEVLIVHPLLAGPDDAAFL